MRKKYSFYLTENSDQEFIEFQKNISEFIKDLIVKFRTGKLVDLSEENLVRRKLLADIHYKELMTEIKKRELQFSKTFDKTPSSQVKTAIKVGVNTESYEPPEEKQIKDVIQNSWNKFVETLKQDSKGEWILTCKLCHTGFILPNKELAIERFKKHLEETHFERVLD